MQTATASTNAFNGATQTDNTTPPVVIPAPSRVILTVKQLAAEQPAFSVGGIRWQIFNRHTNGLEESGAIVRNGSRVYLDREKYLSWLAGETQATGADLAS